MVQLVREVLILLVDLIRQYLQKVPEALEVLVVLVDR